MDEILRVYGLPTALIVAFCVFLWRGLWPFVKERVERSESLAREATKALSDLQTVIAASTEVDRQVVDELRTLSAERKAEREKRSKPKQSHG